MDPTTLVFAAIILIAFVLSLIEAYDKGKDKGLTLAWTQQCTTMKDSEFLQWIHDRLEFRYHESEYADYMIRLEQIVREVKRQEENAENGA
jgi:hypothetical protein